MLCIAHLLHTQNWNTIPMTHMRYMHACHAETAQSINNCTCMYSKNDIT